MTTTHDATTVEIYAGDLQQVLTVEVKATGPKGTRGEPPADPWGQDGDSPTTVRASILPLSGRKFEIARQLVPTATHEIATRWYPGMTPKKRFKRGDRIFNIGHVLNVLEMDLKLLFTCTEDQG